MKKNRTMRVATLLLALTLITSCFVGGTFAKYTTSANSSDTARVANWGFQSTTMDLTGLFDKVYDGDGDTSVSAEADVIAPGTTGSAAFAFEYDSAKGTAPEVAYSFNVSTGGSSCAEDIQKNTNIQWKLDSGAWGTWAQLIDSIEALDGDKDYAPGDLPEAFATDSDAHTVSWRWLFDGSSEGAANLDTIDTAMGNADQLAEVTLKITVTATQLDTYVPTNP